MQAALLIESNPTRVGMSVVNKVTNSDLLAIRAAFNRWTGPVQRLDAEGKRRELADREHMMTALLRLHALSRTSLPAGLLRPVQAVDVERVLSCFRRLELMGGATPAKIADYCERVAEGDDNVIAHRADPLLLRYVLTYHEQAAEAWFADKDLERLRYFCERADLAGMHAWFEKLGAHKETLPKGACQFLRLFLLRLWNKRMGDLETLAFEQAVLEVRLYDTMGWENTRMFCALLRRIGGGNMPAFAAYLNSEDIQEALVLHEGLGDAEQSAHFRALAAVHDARLVGELERAVFANAAHIDATLNAAAKVAPSEPAPNPPAAESKPPVKTSRFGRFFGGGR